MQAIADIATTINPGDSWHREPPTPPMRNNQRVSLATLDTSHPSVANAVKQARAWAARKRDSYDDASMVLSGPYGTGKTHIAKSILWSMTLKPDGHPNAAVPSGRFYLANDLLLKLSPTRDKATGIVDTPRPSSMIGNAPIVVIDDVGGQQILPYVAAADQEHERHARYFRFIDFCYTAMVSVIITTNMSLDGLHGSEFGQHIGGRAFDRLSEMAPKGFMIGLDDVPSWRQKAGGR